MNEFWESGTFNFDLEKCKFVDNLNFLKGMTAEEQTFYKKWLEVQSLTHYINKSSQSKAKIWTPTDINDEQLTIKEIESINPTVVHVNNSNIDSLKYHMNILEASKGEMNTKINTLNQLNIDLTNKINILENKVSGPVT